MKKLALVLGLVLAFVLGFALHGLAERCGHGGCCARHSSCDRHGDDCCKKTDETCCQKTAAGNPQECCKKHAAGDAQECCKKASADTATGAAKANAITVAGKDGKTEKACCKKGEEAEK
jgi:hypothetical protein